MTSFRPRRTCLPLSRTVYRKIPPGMHTCNCFRRPFPSSSHTYTDQRGRLLKHSNRFLNTLSCFITGRNEVVAKVIFLHLSVIHSVHGGVCLVWSRGGVPGLVPGGCAWSGPGGGGCTWSGPRGGTWSGPGGYLPGTPPPDQVHPSPKYGQRAAGTHPTGMHSCSKFTFTSKLQKKSCSSKYDSPMI